jgi:hypothetical protein
MQTSVHVYDAGILVSEQCWWVGNGSEFSKIAVSRTGQGKGKGATNSEFA